MQLSNGGTPNQVLDENMGKYVEEEKAKLKEFYESETQRLKAEHENQKKEKEDLMNGRSNKLNESIYDLDQFIHFFPISSIRYDEAKGAL